jgi:hypothetical protein
VPGTSTTFTAGAQTPPNSAVTVQSAPMVTRASGATCTRATTDVVYLYTLPAAASAPIATKLFHDTANTGRANQTAAAKR